MADSGPRRSTKAGNQSGLPLAAVTQAAAIGFIRSVGPGGKLPR
jgi:hypothetical protein